MTLLAKSKKGDALVTLVDHTEAVMDAGEAMFGSTDRPTRLGERWLAFFKIAGRWKEFHGALLASAAFHDWGKANDGMQAVLQRLLGEQIIRHEHLSALLLALDEVQVWVRQRSDIDWDVVLAAVLGHHLKAGSKDLDEPPRLGESLRLLHEDADFIELMRRIADRVHLSPPSLDFSAASVWAFQNTRGLLPPGARDLFEERRQFVVRRLRPIQTALRKVEERRRLLWAVRAALVAADAAGSGLVRVGEDIHSWIRRMFPESNLCDSAQVCREIICKRASVVSAKRGTPFEWLTIQQQCDDLADRALLLAACGSGKTLGAWRWIAARLKKPTARIIFLYPTRATAKEGFRDYVSWAPDADAALTHGTAAFDLQGMFDNGDDPRHGNRYEVDRRLYALGFWAKRVFSATVDQFLSFMQYGYGSVCLLPMLVDSVVVIDEVHSFDRSMLSALKDFLRHFDIPVLCMTATLPADRRADLAALPMQVCEDQSEDLRKITTAPRYRLRRTTASEVPDTIRKALHDGKRVLWVVNQVKRAQRAAQGMAGDFTPSVRLQERLHVTPGVPLFCYHSRFHLEDRVTQHNAVVEAFRPDCPPALAVTTQVCEMSLDMDADLLVTEECPITALIQRMGRCNRNRTPRENAGEILVYQRHDDQGRPDLNPYVTV